jgi:hypothetical protein
LPENLLAWELYFQARLEGVGPMILELRTIELTEQEAEELAYKLEVIGSTYARIEADEIKRMKDENEVRRRRYGRA